MPARVLVIQFPGVNCEYESRRAVEAVGLDAEIRRWNDAVDAVRAAAAIVIPGGFSYQDRIRAGVVAAKDRVLDAVVDAAERGVPVLGICNGAQILVESGVVPGFEQGNVEVALAPNRMTGRTGYYCTWVHLARGRTPCLFTDFMDETTETVPLPLAHAEGRFVTASADLDARLAAGERVALVYATPSGETATAFPHNPNGSSHAVAGLTNAAGNVLALMPHPERGAWYHQVPRHVGGKWGHGRDFVARGDLFAPGPGMGFFTSLKKALS
jgi:phosphoribosylformylglycinamidine synthase I